MNATFMPIVPEVVDAMTKWEIHRLKPPTAIEVSASTLFAYTETDRNGCYDLIADFFDCGRRRIGQLYNMDLYVNPLVANGELLLRAGLMSVEVIFPLRRKCPEIPAIDRAMGIQAMLIEAAGKSKLRFE